MGPTEAPSRVQRNARLAFEQLTLLVKESEGGRDLERNIREMLKIAIDVILQCKGVDGRFRVTEIYYQAVAGTRIVDVARSDHHAG